MFCFCFWFLNIKIVLIFCVFCNFSPYNIKSALLVFIFAYFYSLAVKSAFFSPRICIFLAFLVPPVH